MKGLSHPTHPNGIFERIPPRCKNFIAYLMAGSHGVPSQLRSIVQSQLLRARKLGLTTSHRSPSPKNDMNAYTTTHCGDEAWDLMLRAGLSKTLDPTLITKSFKYLCINKIKIRL